MLLALIVSNLWQLVRDYRRHVPGSRLRARMVSVLVMVAVTPLVAVYIFSVEFINRGIDNWLNVDVEQGLSDALELGQTVLDIQKRGRLDEVNRFASSSAAPARANSREARRAAWEQRRARGHRLRRQPNSGDHVGRSRPGNAAISPPTR